MISDKHDFAKTLLGHIDLLQGVLTRIESSIQSSPIGQRDELEVIHERLANVVSVMKEDMLRMGFASSATH
jgi:hypothetical protein